ncbi:MAG: response regulator [Bacteroidota bacterium]
MQLRKPLLILICAAFLSFLTGGQCTYAQEYNFLNINVNEGLAQSQVRDILQDKRGFLWIATKGAGISQFDGKRFRTANRYDGLYTNETYDLLEDSRGWIWITHPGGVTLYNGYEFEILDQKDGLTISRASYVAEDKAGNIYVSGLSDGLFQYQEINEGHFSKLAGLPSDTIISMIKGPDAAIYLLNPKQIVRLSEGRVTAAVELPERVKNLENTSLAVGGDSSIILGIGSIIYEWDLAQSETVVPKFSLPEVGAVQDLFLDDKSQLWVGGRIGIARIRDGIPLVFDGRFTNWSMGVTSILQDFDGNIWIGTNGGGLQKFSGEAFIHYAKGTPLENKNTFSILEMEEGVYWAGTDRGLFRIADNQVTNVPILGREDQWINQIFRASDGLVYLAGEAGVFTYQNGRFRELRAEDGRVLKHNNYISEDQSGTIWLARETGVMVIRDGMAYARTREHRWHNSDVSVIEEDSQGNRWYLVRGEGLFRYYQGKYEQVSMMGGRSVANPLRMLEDNNGAIWVATYEGIFRYKDGHKCTITSNEGLYGNTAYLLVLDDDGNLWAGTEAGINKIILDDDSEPLAIKSYGKREGFIGVETNRGAGLKDSQGNLWFGTIVGLTVYRPAEDRFESHAPQISLSNARVQMQEVDWSKRSEKVRPWNLLPQELVLETDESDLRIDFIGLTMYVPEKVRYKYRLLPDTTWSPLVPEQYAAYSNLDYGAYTFEVQAINTDGFTSSEIARIDIYVPTPLTRTRGFRLFVIGSLLFFLYAIVRFRINRLNRSKQILERKVKARTEELETANQVKSEFLAKMSHEIRTPMNGVIGMTDLLRRTDLNERQNKFVENIRISGQNLLSLINDILDFSRIESGKLELESVPLELRQLMEEVLDILAYGAYSKGLELLSWVDHDIRGPIYGDPARLKQILVNLVGNAIKFTEKGQVVVMAKLIAQDEAEATIQISVRDSGIGIPEEKFNSLFDSFTQVDASTTRKYGGTGLGLAISFNLARMMGGNMWVESAPDQGAEFFFTIKGGLSAPWKFLGKDHPAFELIGQTVALAISNPEGERIIRSYLEHWEIKTVTYDSLEAATDALVEGQTMDFLVVDTRLFTEHHLKAAKSFAETCAQHQMHYALVCEPAIAIALEESTNEYGWLLSKPLKRDDLLAALLHKRGVSRTTYHALEEEFQLAVDVPLRILIAEDNPINMDVAQGMLRNLGYAPHGAENGLEVLKMVEEQSFDVVLMDVQMPEMDGLETTRHLVSTYAPAERPLIVAMTANAMESDRQRCLQAGMDTFVSKPFVMDELIELIQGIGAGTVVSREIVDIDALPAEEKPITKARRTNPPRPSLPDPPPVPSPSQAVDPAPKTTVVASNSDLVLTSLDMLNEISGGDAAFIRGILEKLIVKLPEAIQELKAAHAEADWETVRATAHRTKSSAAYSGAPDLKEKFRQLEHMAREQEDLDRVPEHLAELENYICRVVEELKIHVTTL